MVPAEMDGRAVAVVNDVGQPADWVRINVRKSAECFEIYALVPGLLREEVGEGEGSVVIMHDLRSLILAGFLVQLSRRTFCIRLCLIICVHSQVYTAGIQNQIIGLFLS